MRLQRFQTTIRRVATCTALKRVIPLVFAGTVVGPEPNEKTAATLEAIRDATSRVVGRKLRIRTSWMCPKSSGVAVDGARAERG